MNSNIGPKNHQLLWVDIPYKSIELHGAYGKRYSFASAQMFRTVKGIASPVGCHRDRPCAGIGTVPWTSHWNHASGATLPK